MRPVDGLLKVYLLILLPNKSGRFYNFRVLICYSEIRAQTEDMYVVFITKLYLLHGSHSLFSGCYVVDVASFVRFIRWLHL